MPTHRVIDGQRELLLNNSVVLLSDRAWASPQEPVGGSDPVGRSPRVSVRRPTGQPRMRWRFRRRWRRRGRDEIVVSEKLAGQVDSLRVTGKTPARHGVTPVHWRPVSRRTTCLSVAVLCYA